VVENVTMPIIRLRRAGGALAICWLLCSHLYAQERPLRPDGRRLTLGVDSLAVYLIRGPDTTRIGMIVDDLRQVETRLIRIYRSTDAVLGSRLDTIVDEWPGLRPLGHRSVSQQLVHRLEFDSASVTGWIRLANGDSSDVDQPLPPGSVNGASLDVLLRATDLQPGERFTVPAFLVHTRTVVPLRGRVDRSEDLAGQPCWVVVTDFGGMPVTFWIDQRSRRLRQQFLQVGADTGVLFKDPGAAPGPPRRAE
jgi:hypothetical protein